VFLKEVYTANGRVAAGMTVAEIEKILPATSLAFKYDTRIGYKDILVYDLDKDARVRWWGSGSSWIRTK